MLNAVAVNLQQAVWNSRSLNFAVLILLILSGHVRIAVTLKWPIPCQTVASMFAKILNPTDRTNLIYTIAAMQDGIDNSPIPVVQML
jgi:hypothetical protein